MNTLAVRSYTLGESRLVQFFRDANNGSRLLSWSAFAMLTAFAICSVLPLVDARQFNGISLWIKPGKFYISMVVHFFTVAWALSLLNVEQRHSKTVSWSVWAMIICAWSEHFYITYRAAFGEGSHFNVGTPLSAALYSVMAVFAIILVVAPAIIGFKIWRNKRDDLWAQSIAIGFSLGAVLAIIVGMTLGGNSSHWIGGDLTDATGLPIFKWSTSGGDLRVAHFIGLHSMQIVPFAAVSGKRHVVWSVAVLVTIATALTYIQAISGTPLLRP